jgi:hypothetical protein
VVVEGLVAAVAVAEGLVLVLQAEEEEEVDHLPTIRSSAQPGIKTEGLIHGNRLHGTARKNGNRTASKVR